jgi:hypothetical protein
MNAGTGGLSPMAGAGGVSGVGGSAGTAGGVGGFSGMVGAGGAGGMAAGGEGGAGAAGTAGGMTDGGLSPEAPALECEQGRDTLMLLEAGLADPFPYCTAQLPSSGLDVTAIALAITPINQGADAETTWPQRKVGAGECDEGQAFYADASFVLPQISLCPALCDALIETGVENVKLELIYGCDPPE